MVRVAKKHHKEIGSYRHTEPYAGVQEPDVTPPNPANDPSRWRERPCFYVTVKDGPKFGLLAGPFPEHQQAIDTVDRTRVEAEKCDPKAVFYAFGTAKAPDGSKIGILNDRLGIDVDALTPKVNDA